MGGGRVGARLRRAQSVRTHPKRQARRPSQATGFSGAKKKRPAGGPAGCRERCGFDYSLRRRPARLNQSDTGEHQGRATVRNGILLDDETHHAIRPGTLVVPLLGAKTVDGDEGFNATAVIGFARGPIGIGERFTRDPRPFAPDGVNRGGERGLAGALQAAQPRLHASVATVAGAERRAARSSRRPRRLLRRWSSWRGRHHGHRLAIGVRPRDARRGHNRFVIVPIHRPLQRAHRRGGHHQTADHCQKTFASSFCYFLPGLGPASDALMGSIAGARGWQPKPDPH